MSRRDDSGADLPAAALTIGQAVDDIAAVLDDVGVDTALIYGASYGTYLAAGLGVRHQNRVHAMVLDSPLLNCNDFELVRQGCRDLLWHEGTPLAAKVRTLTEARVLDPEDLTIAATIYGIGGADLLGRHLDLLLDGRRRVWSMLGLMILIVARRKVLFHNESDLVGPMGFRELNFAGTPDGLPLDTTLTWRRVPAAAVPFQAEPFDLVTEMPGFRWPTVVVSGGRDLITPSAVARRIADLVPGSTLIAAHRPMASTISRRAPPISSVRPTQPASSQGAAPSITRLGRKRKALTGSLTTRSRSATLAALTIEIRCSGLSLKVTPAASTRRGVPGTAPLR